MSRSYNNNAGNRLMLAAYTNAQLAGNAGTIAAWFQSTAFVNNARILSKANSPQTLNQYLLAVTGSPIKLQGVYGGGSQYSVAGATTLTTGVWHHGASVLDDAANTIRLYLDGVQDGTVAMPVAIGGMDLPAGIGVNANATQYPWNGLLAEVAIWTIDLTAAEIAALAKGAHPYLFRRQNMLAYWPLWAAAPLAGEPDMSGSGNPATLTGSLPAGASSPPVGPLLLEAA